MERQLQLHSTAPVPVRAGPPQAPAAESIRDHDRFRLRASLRLAVSSYCLVLSDELYL
jgi:hypothetical protein